MSCDYSNSNRSMITHNGNTQQPGDRAETMASSGQLWYISEIDTLASSGYYDKFGGFSDDRVSLQELWSEY